MRSSADSEAAAGVAAASVATANVARTTLQKWGLNVRTSRVGKVGLEFLFLRQSCVKPAASETITFHGKLRTNRCDPVHIRAATIPRVRVMNQVAAITRWAALLLFGIAGYVAGCASHMPQNMEASEPGTVNIGLPSCAFEDGAVAESCVVQIFDGIATADATRDAEGRWNIQVSKPSATGPRIALFSAPGHVPVLQAVKAADGNPEAVTLRRAPDARFGYLVGVVFRKVELPANGSVCGIERFMTDKEVIINRVRARFTAKTDNLGSIVVPVPAGRYQVHVEGVSRQVDVPRGDTQLVVMAVE